ncbi:hypothetical protein FKM82_029917 [Ascaphus truei]
MCWEGVAVLWSFLSGFSIRTVFFLGIEMNSKIYIYIYSTLICIDLYTGDLYRCSIICTAHTDIYIDVFTCADSIHI